MTTENLNPAPDSQAPAQDMEHFDDLLGTSDVGDASPPAPAQEVPEVPATPPSAEPAPQIPDSAGEGTPAEQPAEKPTESEIEENLLLDILFDKDAPQQVAPQTPQEQAPEEPEFKPFPQPVEIPDAVIGNLFSEDQNVVKQTLGAMLATTANAAAQAALSQARKEYAEMFTKQQHQAMQQQAGQQMQEQIRTDFYGKYPDLAKYPKVVQQVTKILVSRKMAQDPNAAWSESLRDEIGKYAQAMIVKLAGQKPVEQLKPAVFQQGNARPPMQNMTPSDSDVSGVDDLIDNIF